MRKILKQSKTILAVIGGKKFLISDFGLNFNFSKEKEQNNILK